MLKQRVITSIIVIPVIAVAVWFGVPWLPILAAFAGVVGITEFYRLTGVNKVLPMAVCGTILTVLFIIYPAFSFSFTIAPASVLLTAAVALPLAIMIFLPKQEGLFRMWAWTLTGILYIGWLISYMISIRVDAGRNWLFLMFFCTFGSDIAAYFVGKAFGKHKMAPTISPNKSWEGAIAGVLGSVVMSCLFTLETPVRVPLSIISAIVLGIVVSVFGQVGDLAESMLKRGTGVKDSGTIMPGHGGMMDRLDSLLFAGIAVYLYYMLVYL
jgi:phosphatidate cytidylyltransferase